MMDLKSADPQDLLQELVSRTAGIVLSAPPASGPGASVAQVAVSTVLAAVKAKQVVGLFESYGGNDEPVDPILTQFRELGLTIAFPPIRIKDTHPQKRPTSFVKKPV